MLLNLSLNISFFSSYSSLETIIKSNKNVKIKLLKYLGLWPENDDK